MNENQQNFDELKRLLTLKRHEIPPPGYFNSFSGDVISRIRAGEASRGQTLTERLENQAPWLARFLRSFETQPGVIGACATGLCAILVLGVIFADYSDRSSNKLVDLTGAAPLTGNSVASLTALVPQALADSDSGGIAVSTNPVVSLQPATTLFGQSAQSSMFQNASFGKSH